MPLTLLLLLTLLCCGRSSPLSAPSTAKPERPRPARVFARGEAGCRSVHRQARNGLSMDAAPAAERWGEGLME